MTIDEWLNTSTKVLKKKGIETARLDCLLILENVSRKDQNWILTHGEKLITDEAMEKFNAMLERRAKHEPLAYILGKKEFYGFNFFVNRDVLVPRPETEALVTALIKEAPQNARVLDLGTGSGNIAVSSKLQRQDLNIMASDISKEALAVATKNASAHKTQIKLVESNLFDQIDEAFDIVAANLPYVPRFKEVPAELNFEPDIALFADNDGLEMYEKFFAEVEDYLEDRGMILIEHDPRQFSWLLSFTRRRAQRISDFITALS